MDPESITEIVLIAKKAGKVLTRSVNRFLNENDIDYDEDSSRLL